MSELGLEKTGVLKYFINRLTLAVNPDANLKLSALEKSADKFIGSIADAAIQVSSVFEAAQTAADIYLDAARKQAADIIQEARREADEIIARAESKAAVFSMIHKSNFGPHAK